MSYSVSNFNKNNTPLPVKKVGNIFLLLAAIGGAVAIAPISAPLITAVAGWTAVAGAVGKILTSFKGE